MMTVYLVHECNRESGYAPYDSRTGIFRCGICALRTHRSDLDVRCRWCVGTMRFDGTALVCDQDATHRSDDPSAEDLMESGAATLSQIRLIATQG